MTDQKSINARVLANTLLMKSIGRSSAAVDKFSVWLFAGFGAAVGRLVAKTAQLQGVFVLAQVGLVFAAVHALVFSLAG